MTGFIFFYFYAGVRINDVIQLKGVFHSTFHGAGDKGPLLFVKILVFAQRLAQHDMAVTALFQDLEQYIQDDFPAAVSVSHCLCVLQIESRDGAAGARKQPARPRT